jgi:ribosomal protein L10
MLNLFRRIISMDKKQNLIQQFRTYSESYKNIIVVDYEKVDPNQYKKLKRIAEENGKLLNGKNTVLINTIKSSKNEKLKLLIPYMKNHVCLIFTNCDVQFFEFQIHQLEHFVYQEIGTIVEKDIVIEPQITYISATTEDCAHLVNKQICFSVRYGTIEFHQHVILCKKGEKLGNIEHKILRELGMKTQRIGFNFVVGLIDGEFLFLKDFLEFDSLLKESLQNICQVSCYANVIEPKPEKEIVLNYSSQEEEDGFGYLFE